MYYANRPEWKAVAVTEALILVLTLALIPVAVIVSQVVGTRVDGRDLRWLLGDVLVDLTETEAAVGAGYLRRHRLHRVAGGLFGVALALVVGVRWYGQGGLALGTTSPLADVLFCGIAGVVVGALSAETYRLRIPRSAPVAASLAERPGLPLERHALVARALLGGSALLSLAAGLAWDTWSGVVATTFGAIVVGVAEATRSAVAHRRRPVLSERAQALDGRLRGFAAASVTRLELSIAALVAVWAFGAFPDTGPWMPVGAAGWLAGLVLAVVQLRRAAPRPPRGWGGATLPRTAPA